MDEYTVKITGIVEDCAQRPCIPPARRCRELMELDDDVYNVILSDHKLKLKDSEVAVTNTKESVQDQIQSVIDDLQQIILVMILLGAVLCVAAVYLTVNMMVEENGNTISMLKIFGYRKGETTPWFSLPTTSWCHQPGHQHPTGHPGWRPVLHHDDRQPVRLHRSGHQRQEQCPLRSAGGGQLHHLPDPAQAQGVPGEHGGVPEGQPGMTQI